MHFKPTILIGLMAFMASASGFTEETTITPVVDAPKPVKTAFINPILNAVENTGAKLSPTTLKWMKRWKGIDLEDPTLFAFKELSGSSSVNLKIQKIDPTEEKGYKSYGTFVAVNEAANPNSEIGSFNLAAIIGADSIYRPTIPYSLGTRAQTEFKKLMTTLPIKGSMRVANKNRILKSIEKGLPLKGCIKAKKEDTEMATESMISKGWRGATSLNLNHPVMKLLQAGNSQPKKGDTILMRTDYSGDALTLAREFSIILTIDAVFGQYDRYSGGNIVLMKDENNSAHFYVTDNGGAEIVDSVPMTKKIVKTFSRYDKKSITKIREMYAFLQNPALGFLGYTDANKFVVDLGLYFDISPERYVKALIDNTAVLLQKVKESEAAYGAQAYFEEE